MSNHPHNQDEIDRTYDEEVAQEQQQAASASSRAGTGNAPSSATSPNASNQAATFRPHARPPGAINF